MTIPVIIDTDPGVDDTIAILMAIASPELEILSYTVSFGNTDLDASYLNLLKIYQSIERHLIQYPGHKARFPNFGSGHKPVLTRGSTGPLEGELHSAQYFHGRDGLSDISNRHQDISLPSFTDNIHPYLQLSTKSAVDVSLDILRSRPTRSVTYIALGPLTNLALLMRADSELVSDRIGRVICMGGALDVPGNTSPMAEFNFFADPFAVKELLISSPLHKGIPRDRFLLLPLDITTIHELPFPLYKSIIDPAFENSSRPSAAGEKSPLVHFTSSFLERAREVMIQFGKDAMELHDIVAVWCAIDNVPFADGEPVTLASGWEATTRIFDVERTGEITRGMLVTDRREDDSALPKGTIRSEAQREPHDTFDKSVPGVLVITKTPGPKLLLEMMLQRVWGCSISDA